MHVKEFFFPHLVEDFVLFMEANFPSYKTGEIFVKNYRGNPLGNLHHESDARKQRYIAYELPSFLLKLAIRKKLGLT